MPKFRNFQTNFSGGLLSEGMLGRVDLAQYENGCKVLTNWWPKVTGGMRRRPGSFYLNTSSDATRIESFIFSETQTYLIAFTADDVDSNNANIEIYKGNNKLRKLCFYMCYKREKKLQYRQAFLVLILLVFGLDYAVAHNKVVVVPIGDNDLSL